MKTEENKPYNPKAFPNDYNSEDGMDLRDYFAAKAMQALISNSRLTETLSSGDSYLPRKVFTAAHSYDLADAMLKQREL